MVTKEKMLKLGRMKLKQFKKTKNVAFLSVAAINLKSRIPLMKRLIDEGYSVYVITPKSSQLSFFREIGCTCFSFFKRKFSLSDFFLIHTLKHTLKKYHIRVLYTFTIKANLIGSLAALLTQTKVQIHLTGMGSKYISGSYYKKGLLWLIHFFSILLSSRTIIFNNVDMSLFSICKVLKRIDVLPGTGIDIDYYNQSFSYQKKQIERMERIVSSIMMSNDRNNNQDNNKKDNINLGRKYKKRSNYKKVSNQSTPVIVSYIGRLLKDKGVREFCIAAKRINQKYSSILFLATDFNDNSNCGSLTKKEIERLSGGNVYLIPFMHDLRPLLYYSDLVVLPSYREGMPRSLLEAKAAGVCVLATDVAGCSDAIKQNVDGLLISSKSSQQLEAGILSLVKKPDLRKKYSKQGLARMSLFSVDTLYPKIICPLLFEN